MQSLHVGIQPAGHLPVVFFYYKTEWEKINFVALQRKRATKHEPFQNYCGVKIKVSLFHVRTPSRKTKKGTNG